ncbi:MAG: exodeoxyribonuclease VII large subunit [Clostridiales bacterium]|nr:exodeoxyribonuclease VII large subunit [Clostridiales bacterium]
MSEWILAVSDLNEYVRRTLAADPMLRSLRLRGEISNFKRHTSGHWYFTLKDETSRISCVMFRQNAMRMSIRPMDGMQVILSGSVSLYAEGGAYQFYAENMRPDGLGTLYQQFEALKARLAAEGLFDAGRKRPLPLRPRKIAVVTSRTGAVLQDIRNVSSRRDPGVPLVLLPVQVQGEGAAESIAAAIRKAGTLPGVEVIITGRGGGSMEDLWAFNEESVARSIAASPIPVISAVGHETDVTIADFAADVRASTPSHAAELAVPDVSELIGGLRMMRGHLTQAATARLHRAQAELSVCQRRMELLRPDRQLMQLQASVQQARERLDRCVNERLAAYPPRLAMLGMKLDHLMDERIRRYQEQCATGRARLEALNPTRVLDRGYALVLDGQRVIPDAASAVQHMTLRFRDGTVAVQMEE